MARFSQKPHEKHEALTQAFAVADSNTPRTREGNGSFGFAKTGLPISPAREASVKKAAAVSAANRGAKAAAKPAPVPAPAAHKATKIKKGLLGIG